MCPAPGPSNTKLLIHTATDDKFFEAVIRQVKGNAGGTLANRRQQRDGAASSHASIRKQLDMLANNLTRLGVKAEDLSQVRSKMESLKEQDQKLDKRIRDLDRDIQILETQQIDKKQLRGAFRDFAGLYSDAPPGTKRRLLNVIIEEICCSVKRGKKTGEIIYRLRGDGTIKKAWEEAKQNEESGNPHSGGSTPRVVWLREQDSNLQPCGYGSSTAFAAVRTISSPFDSSSQNTGLLAQGAGRSWGLLVRILIP
jgi:hypothetical protein